MSLIEERKSIQLDLESLTTLIYKNAYPTIPLPRIRQLREKVRTTPALNLNLSRYFDTREQSVTRGLIYGQALDKLIKEENLTIEEIKIGYENFAELSAYLTQITFFAPSLEIQADENQLKEWMPKIRSNEIIGCYAQTELGHGSNVRGLEIQATYDHATQNFIFDSPTDSATKWWIGGLGLISNHALVIAQLIIGGQKYGPHPFLVPLRDSVTHVPFLGVEVGDIGPKIGLPVNDNGFLRFNNYRVPKKYMLTRFSKINEKGEYEITDPNSMKILYMSVVRARLGLIVDSFITISACLTIAIRYSIVRHQFSDPEKPDAEVKLLDYQIQQYKLFTQLSRLYAFVFVKVPIQNLYLQIENDIKAGKTPPMDFLHCIICIYKIFISAKGIEAIEMCRRSCGGHGYMQVSGLPAFYSEYLAKVTYDGENTVLGLQAIKYLISLFHKKAPKEFAYLTSPIKVPTGDIRSAAFHEQCFMAIANYRLNKVNKKFNEYKTRFSKDKIWADLLQVEGIEVLESVFHAHIHSKFSEAIENLPESRNKEALEHLRRVYVGSEIEKFLGDLMIIGVKFDAIDGLKDMLIESLRAVRKDALGLIEAFERNDESLNSILGRKDGQIYEHLLKFARDENPVNKHKVFPGITELLRPKL